MADRVSRVIALDGPAGSGKSTVAREVAARLGWRYVDTGATYRTATLAVLRAGLDATTEPERCVAVVAELLDRGGLRLSDQPRPVQVWLDGEDVTGAIRGPEVTGAVSAVSALPAVRRLIVGFQRALIGTGECVVEGRDIASVVLPDAAVKVYLDAAPEVRARRRAAEPDAGVTSRGDTALVAAVAQDLARRDRLDSAREASPLHAAPDAVVLDTSQMSAEEAVAAVLTLADGAGLRRSSS